MTEELVVFECPNHDLDVHVRAHEAGHAVAAIANGIPFRGLIVYGHGDEPRVGAFHSAAAQIVMHSDDHRTWVQPDPLAALRFAFGGIAGEHAVLNDGLPDSAESDIRSWRAGLSDSREPMAESELNAVVGMPLGEVYVLTLAWAEANAGDIRRLAEHLRTLPASTEMPYDDVVTLLQG